MTSGLTCGLLHVQYMNFILERSCFLERQTIRFVWYLFLYIHVPICYICVCESMPVLCVFKKIDVFISEWVCVISVNREICAVLHTNECASPSAYTQAGKLKHRELQNMMLNIMAQAAYQNFLYRCWNCSWISRERCQTRSLGKEPLRTNTLMVHVISCTEIWTKWQRGWVYCWKFLKYLRIVGLEGSVVSWKEGCGWFNIVLLDIECLVAMAHPNASLLQEKIVVMATINPTRNLLHEMLGESNLPEDHTRKVTQLKDLLERCLMLDPVKRATIDNCLMHQFIREKMWIIWSWNLF